jgi:hypothetical protein
MNEAVKPIVVPGEPAATDLRVLLDVDRQPEVTARLGQDVADILRVYDEGARLIDE